MSIKTIDCSGLSCPEPVLRVRRALEEGSALQRVQVKVSSTVARDNVSRAARSLGWQVEIKEEEGGYILTLNRQG